LHGYRRHTGADIIRGVRKVCVVLDIEIDVRSGGKAVVRDFASRFRGMVLAILLDEIVMLESKIDGNDLPSLFF
jgi:hypothetical protein